MDYANPAGYANRSLIRTMPGRRAATPATRENFDILSKRVLKTTLLFLIMALIGNILHRTGVFSSVSILRLYVISLVVILPETGVVLIIYKIFLGQTIFGFVNGINISAINRIELYVFIGLFGRLMIEYVSGVGTDVFNKSFRVTLFVLPPFISVALSLYFSDVELEDRKFILLYQLTITAISTIVITAFALNNRQRIISFFVQLSLLITSFSINILVFNRQIEWFTQGDVLRLLSPDFTRLPAIGVARMGCVLLLIGFFLFINSNRLQTRIVNLLLILIGVIMVVLANERAPLYSLVFVTTLYILSIGKSKATTFTLKLSLLFITSGIVYLVWVYLLQFLVELGSRYEILYSLEDLNRTRVYYWMHAVKIWFQYPLFGIGVRGFASFTEGYLYPHNIVFDFLVSGGVVAMILWVPAVRKLWMGLRLNKESKLFQFSKYLLLFAFINANVSSDIIINPTLYVSLVIVLMLIEIHQGERRFMAAWYLKTRKL